MIAISLDKDLEFRDALQKLLNRHSREFGSDTPDFILAAYLTSCLKAFDQAVAWREKHSGRPLEGLWWCSVHRRPATRIDQNGDHCCAAELGGITMPCIARCQTIEP